MNSHESAKPSHYNKESKYYDSLIHHEKKSAVINRYLAELFSKNNVETVLDLTCGTGSQVFWLIKKGFNVIGSDINYKMLKIAKEKAENKGLRIKFIKGDMRTTKPGQFDAVITIFNAVGHLTKKDFEKAMQNINANLKPGGLYVFDIFNLNYLLKSDNITKLTIDNQIKTDDAIFREIQYSTISSDGVLMSYDIYHEKKGNSKPKISQAFQTLQVYSKTQLRDMLKKNGFKIIKQCDIDGGRFYDTKTERILTIAKKEK